MTILSVQFLAFLLVLVAAYSLTPKRFRWVILLIGSYAFYGLSNWKYLALIFFTTCQTFWAVHKLGKYNRYIKDDLKQIEDKDARKVAKEATIRKKKAIVAITLLINFALLFFFKTTYMWMETALILPLGISFYTFQTVGYLIDVYRGQAEVESNFFKYALFVSYFPQIIQGPINRYKAIAPSLTEGNRITWTNFRRGFGLFIWGMFKKLVISDRAAIFVSTIWGGDLSDTAGSMILFSVFMFNLQLYTDFSGGIDMVSGVSQLFGIELAENFRRPFFSRTLAEYWRRWHMSLGAWIKDYVFYPIAMSKTFAKIGKKAKARFGVHIGKTLPGAITSVITFVMIGLWHDITIPYVLYGVWHGLIMGLSTMFEPFFTWFNNFFEVDPECLSHRWFQRARTFLLVTFGEYFSLAAGFGVLVTIFKRTFFDFEYPALYLQFTDYGLDNKDWFVLLMATFVLIFVSMKQESGVRIREALEKQELWFQWAATLGLIFVIMIFGIYGPGYDAASFIYGGF